MNELLTHNQLLRDTVIDDFKVLECSVLIEVDHNLTSATYTYEYEIQKQKDCENIWREVFAYPQEDFEIIYVRSTKHNGLKYDLKSLDTPTRNTCLKIRFDRFRVGDHLSFSYKCKTKIGAISNISKFGGNGVVWYWIAHEFSCEIMKIIFQLPQNLTIIDTHPQASRVEGSKACLESKSLVSNEFVPALITYEKKVLGLSPIQSKYFETIFNLILGGLVSLIFSILFL